MIGIKNADKARVLQQLYRYANMAGAKPNPLVQAMYESLPDMPLERARAMIANRIFDFDYIGTKSVKVDLSKDTFDEFLYDRDNGAGQARKALENVPGVTFGDENPGPLELF